MSESLDSAATVSTREKTLFALLSAYSSVPKTLNSLLCSSGKAQERQWSGFQAEEDLATRH